MKLSLLQNKKKFDALYFSLLFLLLVAVFYPSFSYPPLSDSWEMFYAFHHLDQKPGPIKWLHVLNHDPYERMRYQPLSHIFYYLLHLIFGANYVVYNIFNFVFYFLSLFLLYRFSLYLSENRIVAAIFVGIFAFLFSHCDIVLWNCHIYIIAGFSFMLLGFMRYIDYINTANKSLLYLALLFLLAGMWCYEAFWLWPVAIFIIPWGSLRKEKNGLRGEVKMFSEGFHAVSLIYLIYVSFYFLTRTIGTYASATYGVADFFKVKNLALGFFLSFLSVFYNNIAVNILPFLNFPLEVTENIYMGGLFLDLIKSGGNISLVYISAGAGISLVALLFFTLKNAGYRKEMRALFFLLFLLFSEAYTVIFCRLITNDVSYSLREFRYQYVPNAFIILASIAIINRFFKGSRNWRVILIAIVLIILSTNIYFIKKVASIYNSDLANLKRMFSSIKGEIKLGRINNNSRIYIPDDLPDYLPSLCWNVDMGMRFMQGNYQWLFSRSEIKYFSDTISDAVWVVDKSDFIAVRKVDARNTGTPKVIFSGKADEYLDTASYYLSIKNYDKAEGLLNKVIKYADRGNASKAYVGLGLTYNGLMRYEEAKEMFEKAIAINNNIDGYEGLGWIYFDRAQYKKGIEVFRKGLELGVKKSEFYVGLGYCYLQIKELYKAEKVFRKAAGVHADAGLGWVDICKGQPDQAKKWFEKAVKTDPESSSGYIGLGYYFKEKKDYKKAESFLLKANSLDSNNFWVHVFLGTTYNEQGLKAEAQAEFNKAKKINYILFEQAIRSW